MKKVIGKQSLNELRQTKEHQTAKSDLDKELAGGFEKEILLARFFTIKNDIERTISTLQKEIILQRTTLERLDSLLDSLTQ